MTEVAGIWGIFERIVSSSANRKSSRLKGIWIRKLLNICGLYKVAL